MTVRRSIGRAAGVVAALIGVSISGTADFGELWTRRTAIAGQPSWTSLPFTLNANKPYVQASILGSKPEEWMLIDSGAAFDAIDAAAADRLGLPRRGAFEARGAGAGSMRGGFLDDTFVVLAGHRVSLPRPVVLPLRAALARSEGIAIAGLLGAGFLSRHIVDLDYATGTLTVHDPETFVYRGAGSPINLAIEQGHAYITAGLELPDGRRLTARLLVDTGWRNAVAFAAPFVKAERLLDAVPRHVRVVAGVGIGGPTRDRIGRVAAIQLGRHRLERVVVTMSDAGAGVLATDQFAGILGGEILKRFRVVIDYPHGRMFLETTAATAQPFDFDMSGMFLVSDGHRQQTHTVFSVTPGSAASDAQLREGDVIEQFAGASAESLTLEEIRRAFSGPAGKSVALRVRRGSQRFDVTLILRPLV